jgi:sulfotransferase
MKLHALAGLPRSGSTLVANLLSQHPDVYVSGTSPLVDCVEAVMNVLTGSTEAQGQLANVPGTYESYVRSLRALTEGWYEDHGEDFIFDKGRSWVMFRDLLGQMHPGSQMIVCVRDPRDVIASIEKQNRRTPVFHSPLARTIFDAADLAMKPDGMVGGPIRFIEDLIRRNAQGVIPVRFESFVSDPAPTMQRIYGAIGCREFENDFEHIENVSPDLDALWRGKYPHDGSGAVTPSDHGWRNEMDQGLADNIAAAYPLYMETFGYE